MTTLHLALVAPQQARALDETDLAQPDLARSPLAIDAITAVANRLTDTNGEILVLMNRQQKVRGMRNASLLS
jgi:hypothetical protein